MSLRVAAAPISWGVCEVPGWGRVLDRDVVLAEMAALGATATELGPPGYLPEEPAALRALLAEHRLALVAGFLAVVLHTDPDAAVAEAVRSAELLASAGAEVLVLAAATGLDGYDERPTLTDAQWQVLIDTCARIAAAAAEAGLTAVLHPHVGTHVERADEVERFLADATLPLCLDTGHLMIGGTDPVALARRYPDRIGHVHLKDVRTSLAAEVRAGRLTYTAAVRDRMYVPLGDGDIDVAAIVTALTDHDYTGWYVLEQDTALTEGASADTPRRDVARSIDHLGMISTGSWNG